ncbi:hypothetical protein ACFYOF_18655 [Streptomyces sp. NPDC007148]
MASTLRAAPQPYDRAADEVGDEERHRRGPELLLEHARHHVE